MEQIYNPYLPLNEYIPDGEPHVFGDRVYVYGSHDEAGGKAYCPGHYAVWSAPVDDLKSWRFEGESYKRTQDPSNKDDEMQLWAPDVTKGPDGRYYIYYCFSFNPEIGVAVSDSPAGPFEFYGHVKYPSSIKGGKILDEYMPFDPAVLTDDDGRVYLYYGFAQKNSPPMSPEKQKEMGEMMAKMKAEMEKLIAEGGKMPKPRMASDPPCEGGMAIELESDMLTIKSGPDMMIPGMNKTAGTGFEGHGFYEASSIRKLGGKYYFTYSSELSHELCYAVSGKPTTGYKYGGTLVSNGDVGLGGRKDPVCAVGNNHGGMELIGGQLYIFYHRQTNATEFSRQGCAEKLYMLPDGSIKQVEITSCGLNGGPLLAKGVYPASIACHLTCSKTSLNTDYFMDPKVAGMAKITEADGAQFITNIDGSTIVGYKYFDFENVVGVSLTLKGKAAGTVTLSTDEGGKNVVGEAALSISCDDWQEVSVPVHIANGVHALYLHFSGDVAVDFKELAFVI